VVKAASNEPKKPYVGPELVVYGKVSDLTQSHTSGAHPDGGHLPKNRGTALG
jgi:hypothetical protein